MTTVQINKLKMYLALRVLLKANPQILAKLPNANEFLTSLDAVIIEIQANSAAQQEGNEELLNRKRTAKEKLTTETLETSRKLQAYASYKKDSVLMNAVKVTETDLSRMVDLKLIEFGKSLHNKINERLADLAPYGLTAETQTALAADILDFETLCPQVTKENRDQTNITSALRDNYKNADSILADLDLLVEMIHTSEPKFYDDYKALRHVEVPAEVVQLVVKVTDAGSGAPVPNASAVFTLAGGTKEPITKQSAAKGGFQVKTMPEGIYSVTVSKIGYQTQTLSVTITGDEQVSMEVKMVKG